MAASSASSPIDTPLADPVAEALRLVASAGQCGLVVRVLGGAAVLLRAPGQRPLIPREVRDIDIVTPRGAGRALEQLLPRLGYLPDEMFNALHGARRQLHVDPVNHRKLDIFVGGFSMCHQIPIVERLEHEGVTVPPAELLLTKLQIVELNERDEHDIYTLCYHHELIDGPGPGIDAALIADLCARDWGLWRTCCGTIERCCADLPSTELAADAKALIEARLRALRERIDAAEKSSRWRRRAWIGERVRWYEQPEELE